MVELGMALKNIEKLRFCSSHSLDPRIKSEDVAVVLFMIRGFRYGLGWEVPRLAPLARDDIRHFIPRFCWR